MTGTSGLVDQIFSHKQEYFKDNLHFFMSTTCFGITATTAGEICLVYSQNITVAIRCDYIFLWSRVRASWINVNNCPTRCDYIVFNYISADSSTWFAWYPHPSSGAHSNCNCNIWHWSNRICYRPLTCRSRNCNSVFRLELYLLRLTCLHAEGKHFQHLWLWWVRI
jgi:hypothetical protein